MNRKYLDYHRLQVFIAVYDTRSFTKAAAKVRLSQPTVSEHIRNLEETVEERLFDRIGKTIIPTQAAELLYNYACQLDSIQNEAIQELGRFTGKMVGDVLIGASSVPAGYVLPEYISAFVGEHPGVRFHVQTGSSREIASAVHKGALELGVIGADWDDPELITESIFNDELVLAVPYNHPVGKYSETTLERLKGIPLISRESGSGTRQTTEKAFRKAGIDYSEMNHVLEIGSSEAVRECVIAGVGASFISEKVIAQAVKEQRIKFLRMSGFQIRRTFYLLTRKGRTLAPVAKTFVDALRRNI